MNERFGSAPDRLRRGFLSLLLALCAGSAGAAGNDLPLATNLRAEAEQARLAGGPLIVIYSRPDCKYCELVKRDYLKPLAASPHHKGIVVRQVNQDSDAPLTDFRGEKTTQARFASSERIKLVPVVAFYGTNGKQLAEPIIGARLPDFYQSYLEEAIEKSAAALGAH